MLPAVVIAGAVILSSTALAWMFDRKTEQERQLHTALRRHNCRLRENYAAACQADARHREVHRARLAQRLVRSRADACQEFLDRMDGPRREFEAMEEALRQALKDASISSYRRNALRLMQARLEDARNRLTAFHRYGNWYLERQQDLLNRGQYDAVIDFPDPDSRLPDDWYYDGKVALAELHELSRCNAFGQQLTLRQDRLDDGHYSDAFQRSLVLQYPDQDAIPVQIHARNNPHYFQACVLRGALYVEHALEQLPFPAIVSRFRHDEHLGSGYDLQCFPAFFEPERQHGLGPGVRAFLPHAESSFPGKRYSAGERIDVYLHHHDLGLRSQVTVTQQLESLQLGTASSAPIFMCADGRQHDLHPLLETAAQGVPWQLRECLETDEGLYLRLQLGDWQVHAQARPDDEQLQVMHLEHTGLDSVDVDELPFRLRLIDDRLRDSVFTDLLCFQGFLHFCRQQALFGADEEDRKEASRFFTRWSAVNEFLLEETGYRTLFLNPQGTPDQETWTCRCEQNLETAVHKLLDGVRRPPRLYLEERFMGHHGERWLRVGELRGVPERVAPDTFQIHHGGIRRPDSSTAVQEAPRPLRLRLPNAGELANLSRQQRALQAFMSGRLHNPALQHILLMPHRCEPHADPTWARRVEQGLRWQDPNWQATGSAAHAKRIVTAALVESNLYLIQGPPGTGKTTCIVELLHQVYLAQPDARVLVVSQQNTAVDNALDRFLKRYPEFATRLLRISGDATKVEESLRPRVTAQVLMDYLAGRQREYSQSAALGQEARAAWVDAWIRRIYRSDASGAAQFDGELSELLVQDFPLVGATCVGLASSRHGLNRLTFDLCIIDEAGRSTVPELLIPLMRSRKAILIGDHFQLPPSVASRLREADAKDTLPFLEDTFLKTSFFEQLYEHLPEACRGRLNEQFRMAGPIGDLVAELFYTHNGQRGLHNGRINGKPRSSRGFLDERHVIRWYDVPQGRQEKESGKGPSLVNRAEADAILHYLQAAAQTLSRRPDGGRRKKTVAIITPYSGQKRFILQQIERLRTQGYRLDEFLAVEVDTVDSFQGSEADIVLYSTVRTQGDIRFLLDRQRLNVACSRARENLVFFGATDFLRRHESRTNQPLFIRILERASVCTLEELRRGTPKPNSQKAETGPVDLPTDGPIPASASRSV